MSFADDIKKFELKATKNIDVATRQIALALFTKVVERTPVGNPTLWKNKAPKGYVGGRARGNWQCSVGPNPVAVESDTVDAEGTKTLEQVLATMGGWSPTKNEGVPIWIGNALPYMIRLEYDAWSSQAKAGMVRISVSEIRVKTQTGQI